MCVSKLKHMSDAEQNRALTLPKMNQFENSTPPKENMAHSWKARSISSKIEIRATVEAGYYLH